MYMYGYIYVCVVGMGKKRNYYSIKKNTRRWLAGAYTSRNQTGSLLSFIKYRDHDPVSLKLLLGCLKVLSNNCKIVAVLSPYLY